MPAIVSLAGIALDASASEPLYRQLYDALRDAVLTGRIAPGTRLPATRDMSKQLGVSRNTVMMAFEQLVAEGYLEGRVGAGTYVATALPDELLNARVRRPRPSAVRGHARLSERGKVLGATPVSRSRLPDGVRAFRIGLPDLDLFPFETWARIATRVMRRPNSDLLMYGDPAGYRPLREAIAEHVGAARAVRCGPEQVIVVSGSQQALDLSARLLLDPGDDVWFEDPGYLGARAALIAAGARIVPVTVDDEGLDVAAGEHACPSARAVYVTPSHQFPLCATMSLPRRLALLDWARRAGAWVLEDDFDSEYRYAGRPLAALQGLDTAGRVVYFGTFSKVMFPSLRLGYLIVPPHLVDAFVAARAIADRHSPSIEQAVLAEFIAEGHLARHIRRMRVLYGERQQALLASARFHLRGLLGVRPVETGMHVVGWLPPGSDDAAASRRALERGVDASPLSAYCVGRPPGAALLLGYSGVDERAISAGMCALAEALGAGQRRARA